MMLALFGRLQAAKGLSAGILVVTMFGCASRGRSDRDSIFA